MTTSERPGTAATGREPTGAPRYVVGVDGSEPSIEALRWALSHAAMTGAEVVAVAMWHFPPVGLERPSLGRKLHAEAETMVERAVAEAVADSHGLVSVSTEVYQYPAAERLIDMSEHADLVVVGRRSRHALGPLGSVSERVATHAHCPVVVIPAGTTG